MCSDYPDENTALVDSFSFSQITPPPVHRKFTTIGRSESVQVFFQAKRTYILKRVRQP